MQASDCDGACCISLLLINCLVGFAWPKKFGNQMKKKLIRDSNFSLHPDGCAEKELNFSRL